jgi:hypothetical protein
LPEIPKPPLWGAAAGEEAPASYMAFGGSHHGGCWEVVLREAADFVLSLAGGLLMLYLLLVAAAEGVRLTGASSPLSKPWENATSPKEL